MSKITKKEKTLRKGITQWKNFLNEGAFKPQVQEARMGEYGKIDAEDGNPPSKIGRGNEEYMAAYNAVLQSRGEQPLDIQQPDAAYLDALRSGKLEEGDAEFKVGDKVIANGYPGTITDLSIPGMATVALKRGEVSVPLDNIEMMGDDYVGASPTREGLDERSADDDRDLEEPVKYGTGHELEWDPKAQKLYDRKRDIYLSDEEEDAVVAARQAEVDRKNKEFDMRRQNKEFGSAPYHFEEGAGHDESLAQAQNQGVAFIRGKDDKAAGKEKDPSFSEESGRNPLEVLFYNAGYDQGMDENFSAKTEGAGKSYLTGEQPQEYDTVSLDGAEYEVKMVMPNGDVDISRDGRYGSESLTISPDNLEFISREGEEATFGESNEPFDMGAHMAAYENEPETIEYRKQIKQLVQMVADKKGIPVEQAAKEIASYVVTAGGLREAIGAMNTSQTTRYGVKGSGYGDGKKPSPAPAGKKLSGTQKALAFIKDRFGKDAKELGIDTFELTMHIGRPKTDEELRTKVIDFIQKNDIKIKEGAGAGDKEAKIRDVVKMGSWDNIDGVSLSLPQAELLVAAMDNLSPANKEKLMAMPIDKMLDIVNKMVDAGVITVDYGRAGLKEYGDHDAQASGGLVHSTYSSDPELDQIEDIAKDMLEAGIQNSRIPVGLNSVASALKAQGFDATMSGGVLNIDGKYFMGKESMFDISPNEDVRRVMEYVIGYMG